MPISTGEGCAWTAMSRPPSHKRIIGGVLSDGLVLSAMLCVAVDAEGEAPGGWWSDELMRLYEPTHWIPVPSVRSEAEGICDKACDPVLLDVGR